MIISSVEKGKEEIAKGVMPMYISPVLFPYSMEILVGKLQASDIRENFEEITRPLYHLKFVKKLAGKILCMAQISATEIHRTYQCIDFGKKSRLYVEETENGLAIFMISVGDGSDLGLFGRLIGA